MSDSWKILKKELAYYGFRLKGDGVVEMRLGDGVAAVDIGKAEKTVRRDISENAATLRSLLDEAASLLSVPQLDRQHVRLADDRSLSVFIHALKDLAKFIHIFFPSLVGKPGIYEILERALSRDIASFSDEQIARLPAIKIAIDWLVRLNDRLEYAARLLRFASKGEKYVAALPIKTARGVSGPWSNLDLPFRERVWGWWEEDENFRGRARDIRKQRRYTKGLENYNNDGRVGEGHYWREIRNEPYSWYDQDSPYPSRNVLFNH